MVRSGCLVVPQPGRSPPSARHRHAADRESRQAFPPPQSALQDAVAADDCCRIPGPDTLLSAPDRRCQALPGRWTVLSWRNSCALAVGDDRQATVRILAARYATIIQKNLPLAVSLAFELIQEPRSGIKPCPIGGSGGDSEGLGGICTR